jgi:hypothetical protein
VATTESEPDGSYNFGCITPGTGYAVDGLVIIDGTPYTGLQTGIQVLGDDQVTSPVDIILFP